MFRPEAIFVALLLSLSFATADTSLYIPGFEGQDVSVTAIGVDPNGRTTWVIEPGHPTGTDEPPPLPITATMVQGPSDAILHLSVSMFDVSLSCAFNSGVANCVGDVEHNGMTVTTSLRESVKPFLVQGGGYDGSSSTPSPIPSPTPAPSQTGSTSGGGDHGSALTNDVTGVGVFVGGVVAGVVTLFLV